MPEDIYTAAMARILAEGELAMRSFRQENETIDLSFRNGTLHDHITTTADQSASTLDEETRRYIRRRTSGRDRTDQPGSDPVPTPSEEDPGQSIRPDD